MYLKPLSEHKVVNQEKLELTKLMFGGGPFSGFYGSLEGDWPLRAVQRAFELGINGFDTSPYYGDSEIILGDALHALGHKYPRNTYYIATKVGRYGPLKGDFDYSSERVEKSVNDSLARLKTEYLDIVFAHDVEFVDVEDVVGINGALSKLFELKKKKKIRYVGISGYPLDVLLKIAKIQHDRHQPIDIILSYCHYTLQSTLLVNYIQKFRKEAEVKYVLNASPLSMGLLRNKPPPNWHPASTELKEAVKKCAEIATNEYRQNISKLAVQFSLGYDEVETTVIGFSNNQEVEESVAWLHEIESPKLNENTIMQTQLLDKIKDILAPHYNQSWASPPPE
ncbi:3201_t:CDS:2 [Ambispora gerdemannii]|uniref:3201_t:CDS:1 n=1 Tax=Ambispora gerdemannii TaxID=144530 RepID=A0A9N8V682_9GLOM|nr:3201_t:CDS:2 [Ambispora gerdemannii]